LQIADRKLVSAVILQSAIGNLQSGKKKSFHLEGAVSGDYIVTVMYEDFYVNDRFTGQPIHCMYQALIVAIATRHADAVDIKFLVNGRTVWISLPHVAWVEFNKRTGKVLTDPLAVQAAGHYLKYAIESGLDAGREMYNLTVPEALQHLFAVLDEARAIPDAPLTPVRPEA